MLNVDQFFFNCQSTTGITQLYDQYMKHTDQLISILCYGYLVYI